VTLANPFGALLCWDGMRLLRPYSDPGACRLALQGWRGYRLRERRAKSELAYTVEMERMQAKVEGREDITPITARVTTIFRPEEGAWKVVHRHADPITSARPAESVIRE
jgi:hypothetical protein